mmetsp:Transcript_567/g.1532  ORF Transcript_567/g.1532 Transcript_567/m.1532 type:complete len:361 (-) Transcript_567:37-1119(-)
MDPLRTTEVHRRPATSQEFCARLRGFEAALRAEKGAAVSIPPAWTGWGSGDEPPDALPPSPPTPAVLVPASEHASSPAAEAPALPLPAGPSEAGPSADPLAATPARRLLLVVGVGGLDQHFASKRLPILLRGAKQSKRFDAVRPLYTCKLECCTAAVTPPLPAGEVTHLVIVGESNPPSETVPLVMREARALVARSEGASIAASPVLLAAEWVGNDLCAPGREAKHTLRPPPAARSPPPEEESPSLKRRRGASAPNSPARSESPAPALAPAAAAEAAAKAGTWAEAAAEAEAAYELHDSYSIEHKRALQRHTARASELLDALQPASLREHVALAFLRGKVLDASPAYSTEAEALHSQTHI